MGALTNPRIAKTYIEHGYSIYGLIFNGEKFCLVLGGDQGGHFLDDKEMPAVKSAPPEVIEAAEQICQKAGVPLPTQAEQRPVNTPYTPGRPLVP